METKTQIIASDRHRLDAYISSVLNAQAALVVIQEIFGVNHHIRSVVTRFAGEGLWTIAPALFDRIKPGIELKYDEEGVKEGKKLAYGLKQDEVLRDIDAAIRFARKELPDAKVGVVGYCFGGSYAWLSAIHLDIQAAVCYYGSMIAETAQKTPQCPVLMHFGEKDKTISAADRDKIRVAHPQIPIHVYEAGHGFSCDERESYSPEATALAFSRTIQFLNEHLIGRS